LFLIEKAFEQFYWNQEWNEIQKILIRFRERVQRKAINATISKEAALERDAFQDSVDRLKEALTWTYCRKTYQQKLGICNELKKRFKNTDWKDLIKIVMGKASKLSFEKTVRFCKYQVIIFQKNKANNYLSFLMQCNQFNGLRNERSTSLGRLKIKTENRIRIASWNVSIDYCKSNRKKLMST
jgi:hypothetical protein